MSRQQPQQQQQQPVQQHQQPQQQEHQQQQPPIHSGKEAVNQQRSHDAEEAEGKRHQQRHQRNVAQTNLAQPVQDAQKQHLQQQNQQNHQVVDNQSQQLQQHRNQNQQSSSFLSPFEDHNWFMSDFLDMHPLHQQIQQMQRRMTQTMMQHNPLAAQQFPSSLANINNNNNNTSLIPSTTNLSLSLDIIENPSEYILRAECPGVRKEDLKLELERGAEGEAPVLTISGESKYERVEQKGSKDNASDKAGNEKVSKDANAKRDSNKDGYHYIRRECAYGSMSRSLRLPKDCQSLEQIHADYKDGVLTISLPRSQTSGSENRIEHNKQQQPQIQQQQQPQPQQQQQQQQRQPRQLQEHQQHQQRRVQNIPIH